MAVQNEQELELELDVTDDTAETVGRWWHRPDLDRFFKTIYQVFDAKGFSNIVMKGILDHLNIVFVLFVVLFLVVVLDFHDLNQRLEDPCPGDPIDLTTTDCQGRVPIKFARLMEMSWIAYIIVFIFLGGWLFSLVWFLSGVSYLRTIRSFYEQELNISHRELQTIRWNRVVEKLSEAQSRLKLCTTTEAFDLLDVANLIARKQNFLIALYANDKIRESLEIPVPFMKPRVVLARSLQWNIEKILFSVIIFDGDSVVPEVFSNPDRISRSLRRYFKIYGLVNLLLAPFILVFQLAYFFFHNSDSLRRSAGPLSTRQWSPYATWMMRNYSESEHAFRHRLRKSYKPANRYIESFVSELLTIWARFVVFIFGGCFVVLTALGFIYDEDFLFSYLTPDRSVIWWTGIIGAILAGTQSLIPDEAEIVKPEKLLNDVKSYTHYGRAKWEGREESLDTFDEFSQLYQLKIVNFIEELISILLTPYLLMMRLPQQSDEIVDFFSQHSYKHPYLPGHFCRFAFFRMNEEESIAYNSFHTSGSISKSDFDGGADMNYSIALEEHSSKMEYSIAAFNAEHPEWSPPKAEMGYPAHLDYVDERSELSSQSQQQVELDDGNLTKPSGSHHNSLLQPLIAEQ